MSDWLVNIIERQIKQPLDDLHTVVAVARSLHENDT